MIGVSRGVGRAPGMLALAVLALSGCGGAGAGEVDAVDAAPSVPATATASAEGLPAHWRWESYGSLEIGVPADWGYETAERPWCIKSSTEGPFVGRPGGVPLIGCSLGDDDGADPATVLSSGGTFVWLTTPSPDPGSSAKAGTAREPVHAGDRDTVVVAGVQVAVQAPAALRHQILSTLRVVNQQDHNGCRIASPFAGNPQWRPDGPAVTTLTEVRAVSACAYTEARLTSSLRLQDEPAAAAIAAVAAAPIGGGPNLPAASCTSDDPVRDDIIVLQVSTGHGESKVVLRYGGCFHRGLDDGTAVRTLTRPAVLPFVAGPNRVTAFSGEALTDILRD